MSLVKIDATANDVSPNFDVRGFPTLYWLPKDSKNKPIRYEVNIYYILYMCFTYSSLIF